MGMRFDFWFTRGEGCVIAGREGRDASGRDLTALGGSSSCVRSDELE